MTYSRSSRRRTIWDYLLYIYIFCGQRTWWVRTWNLCKCHWPRLHLDETCRREKKVAFSHPLSREILCWGLFLVPLLKKGGPEAYKEDIGNLHIQNRALSSFRKFYCWDLAHTQDTWHRWGDGRWATFSLANSSSSARGGASRRNDGTVTIVIAFRRSCGWVRCLKEKRNKERKGWDMRPKMISYGLC
jgi:hypothetical protein